MLIRRKQVDAPRVQVGGRINKGREAGEKAVKRLLWQVAALEDLDKPTLGTLARVLDVHPTTFSAWVRNGCIPKPYYEAIYERYGARLEAPEPYFMKSNENKALLLDKKKLR